MEIHNNQAGTSRTTFETETEEISDAEEAEKKDYAKEWQCVAEVFDRLFFWLFLLAILISTLVLFHPLTDSYIKRWKETES